MPSLMWPLDFLVSIGPGYPICSRKGSSYAYTTRSLTVYVAEK